MKRLALLLVIFTLPLMSCSEEQTVKREVVGTKSLELQAGEHFEGSEDAKVVVIEYSSLSCPHCAEYFKNHYPEVKKKYIDTGKIKYVHRDFPLNAPAFRATQLLKCVGQEKRAIFKKVLFTQQENWAFKKTYLEELENIAKLGGIGGDEFTECIDNRKLENEILEEAKYANEVVGIDKTPTFFVNSESFSFTGFIDFENSIEKYIN